LDVALVTCHWKLLHELPEGIEFAMDVHVPAYEPDDGVGAGAEGALAVGAGVVGSRTSELLSKRVHAVENVEAAANTASSNRVLFMVWWGWRTRPPASMVTSLCARARNCACNTR
jgi:hypothetical protein